MPYEANYKKPQLPDPLHGLSPYIRQKLLTMRPTWSERHRMAIPYATKEERLDVLIDILFERRAAYDREFHQRCKQAEYERANQRYLDNEQHLTDHRQHSSTALSAIKQRRHQQEAEEQHIRAEYFRRREQRNQYAEEQRLNSQPDKKRKRRMGMSR